MLVHIMLHIIINRGYIFLKAGAKLCQTQVKMGLAKRGSILFLLLSRGCQVVQPICNNMQHICNVVQHMCNVVESKCNVVQPICNMVQTICNVEQPIYR